MLAYKFPFRNHIEPLKSHFLRRKLFVIDLAENFTIDVDCIEQSTLKILRYFSLMIILKLTKQKQQIADRYITIHETSVVKNHEISNETIQFKYNCHYRQNSLLQYFRYLSVLFRNTDRTKIKEQTNVNDNIQRIGEIYINLKIILSHILYIPKTHVDLYSV